jgi:hypothetical protein
MSFADVDGEEIGSVVVIVVQLGEMTHLATEGRSSVASEDENQGARTDVVMQKESGLAVERD